MTKFNLLNVQKEIQDLNETKEITLKAPTRTSELIFAALFMGVTLLAGAGIMMQKNSHLLSSDYLRYDPTGRGPVLSSVWQNKIEKKSRIQSIPPELHYRTPITTSQTAMQQKKMESSINNNPIWNHNSGQVLPHSVYTSSLNQMIDHHVQKKVFFDYIFPLLHKVMELTSSKLNFTTDFR